MPPAPHIIEGPYVHDILEQPAALARTVAGLQDDPALRQLACRPWKRIILTGMGGSLHALYLLHLRLTNHGLPSLILETAELLHYFDAVLDQQTLLVVVSQSGRSAEIVHLLDAAAGRAPVIAITNTPEAPLATRAQAVLFTHAGPEATVSCKTWVSTLPALEWLGAIFAGADLDQTRAILHQASPAVASYLENWRSHTAEFGTVLEGIRQFFVTGRGPSLAPALTGGLILKESTRSAAEGMSSAAFRHGPWETLGAHVFVIILEGDHKARMLNRAMGADIREAGGFSALVSPDADIAALRIPAVDDAIRPILEMLPIQMLTLAIAARLGREAGRFELATKVTDVE